MQVGWEYVEIKKGKYDLPQAGLLAQKFNKNKYKQSSLKLCLWKHHTQPVQFCFVVDDFGVKYMGKEHAKHKRIIEQHYKVSMDWSGTK